MSFFRQRTITHSTWGGRFASKEKVSLSFLEWVHQYIPLPGFCRATVDTKRAFNWDERRGPRKVYRCVQPISHGPIGHYCPPAGAWFIDARKKGEAFWTDSGTK